MSSANIGWLFYKGYYKTLNNNDYIFMLLSNDERKKRKEEQVALNKKITTEVTKLIGQSVIINNDEMLGNTHFKATTTYPGLLLGSGNAHELPSIEGQAILGFHFDYTSGLPVIQGSSIKGVLRSAFPLTKKELEVRLNNKKLSLIEKEDIKALTNNRKAYLLEYVNCDIDILKEEIFNNGDVFFDANIISNGKILGDDFITPHGDDPLKNPIPLRFIKVLPDVTFRFDFELSDGILSKSEKETLFRKILYDLGLGAKTNVGYGKFTDFKAIAKTKEEIALEEALEAKKEEERLNKLSPVERVFDKYENSIPDIINAMKAKEIEEILFKKLAEEIKAELIKKPKEWEKAKQKALKRKEYIERLLD